MGVIVGQNRLQREALLSRLPSEPGVWTGVKSVGLRYVILTREKWVCLNRLPKGNLFAKHVVRKPQWSLGWSVGEAIGSNRVDLNYLCAEVKPNGGDTGAVRVRNYVFLAVRLWGLDVLSGTSLRLAMTLKGFVRTTSCKYCYLWMWIPKNDIMEALGINRTNNIGLNWTTTRPGPSSTTVTHTVFLCLLFTPHTRLLDCSVAFLNDRIRTFVSKLCGNCHIHHVDLN